METFAYLHTACAYDDPEAAELSLNVEQLNVEQWSGQASLLILQLLVPVAILAIAGQASALQAGDRGPSVTVLQDRLRQLRYFNHSSTGIYKSITENAVRRFQEDRGLRVDGIAGPETRRALGEQQYVASENILPISSSSSSSSFSSTTVSSTSINNAGFSSTTQSSIISTSRVLGRGSSGADVKELQQILTKRGYPTADDGIFGSRTDRAVRQFQAANGLDVDGRVGTATRSALGLELNASIRKLYVVVVPLKDSTTLSQVQQRAPGARIASSNLGKYVQAGAFDIRGLAEAEATRLRAYRIDAQVRYF